MTINTESNIVLTFGDKFDFLIFYILFLSFSIHNGYNYFDTKDILYEFVLCIFCIIFMFITIIVNNTTTNEPSLIIAQTSQVYDTLTKNSIKINNNNVVSREQQIQQLTVPTQHRNGKNGEDIFDTSL